jgi:hypothetical protein
MQLPGSGGYNLIATNGSVVYPPGGTSLTSTILNANNYTSCMMQSDGTYWRILLRS